MTTPDVLEAAKPWMQQCGPHDYGLAEMGCACPPGDPRAIVSRLVAEIERLRAVNADLDSTLRFAEKRTAEAFERRNDAERRLWAARMVRCWTNEDGKRFVFTDDLFAAIDPDLAAKATRSTGDVA